MKHRIGAAAEYLGKCFAYACLVFATAMDARAAELTYGLDYVAERSSNIERVSSGEEDETIDSVILSARYREMLPTFRSEVAISGERREYRQGVFQDESLFLFDGTAVWIPVPHLSWTVADSYRNVPVSRALPDTPANREDTNVFLTGPGFEWRITPADYLIAEARYGRFDAETSDIDNDRQSLAIRWRHRESSLAEHTANYEYVKVVFDNDIANNNYQRHDVYYRAQLRRSRNELVTDLGYTFIDRERSQRLDGSLFRVTAARDVTSVRRVGVSLTAEYSDTAFSLAPSGLTVAPPPASTAADAASETLTGDVFYTKRAEAFMTSLATPFPWSINVFSSDVDYEVGTADSQDAGLYVNISYLRRANLGLSAYSGYTRSEYPLLHREDRDTVNGLVATFRLRPSLRLSLEGQRAERRSSDPLQSYIDDRIFLRLGYSQTRRWN